MKYISIIIMFVTLLSASRIISAQSKDDLSREIECPCLIEMDLSGNENLNTADGETVVLKFISAEVKGRLMICNYENVLRRLNNLDGFKIANIEDEMNNWDVNNNFNAMAKSYFYGDLSTAKFGESLNSAEIGDSSYFSLQSISNGTLKLNETSTGFVVKRNDVIKMKSLSPASSVPKTLGRKRNNTIPKKIK